MPIKLDVLGFFQWVLGMELYCAQILGSEAFFFFLAQNKTIVGHRLQSLWELGWYYFVIYCLAGRSSTQ